MAGTKFPSFLTLEHQPDGRAKMSFLAELAGVSRDAKRQVQRDFAEIGQVINNSISGFKAGGFKLDLGVSGLREAAAAADANLQKLLAMRNAAINLRRATGDTSAETYNYITALRAQVLDAERSKKMADSQVTSYDRLQGAMDRTVASNRKLAESYRATFAEQAKAANFTNRYQSGIEEVFAPGLNRPTKSAQESASVFANQRFKVDAFGGKEGVAALLAGQAALDRAAASGATLESVLGRVSVKSKEVAAANEIQARAQAKAAAETDRLSRELEGILQVIDPAAAAQKRFAQSTEIVNQAVARGVITQGQAAKALDLLQAQMVQNSGAAGSYRVAMVQTGQQLQDVAISLYSGQRAAVVFAQQLPQLAFALSGMGGRVGAVATVLSGPWSLALVAGAALLGTFVERLISTGKETDKTKDSQRSFLDVMRDSKAAWEEVTKAAREYTEQQEKSREVTLLTIKAEAESTAGKLREAIAIREKLAADLEAYEAITRRGAQSESQDVVRQGAFNRADRTRDAISANRSVLIGLQKQAGEVVIKAADAVAGINSDPAAQIKAGFDVLRNSARATIKDVDALTKRLTDLNRQEKAATDTLRESTRRTSTPRGDLASFIMPVQGRITSGFGARTAPTAGASTNHRAIDIAAPTGTGIRAPQIGTVTAIGFDRGLGKYVVIDHGGGTKTRFGHLSDNSVVSEGQTVQQGDLIGKVGSTGRSTGPHLHYQVLVNGKPVDPSKGSFPIDPVKVAEAADRAGERLREFGESASASIQRITDRFDEQPRLIDQVNTSADELKRTLADLTANNDNGQFDAQIEAGKRALALTESAVRNSILDQTREMQQQYQIQLLLLSGRDREAAVAQRIADAQRQYGDDLGEIKADVIALAELEYDRAEAIERATEAQAAYLDATRSVRSEVEAILAGQGKLSNFKQIFKQLQGRVLAEQLFGDVFRDLDKWVKEKTGIGSSVDAMAQQVDRAGDAAQTFADAVLSAANRISASGAGGSLEQQFDSAFAPSLPSIVAAMGGKAPANNNGGIGPNGEIIVARNRPDKNTVNGLSPKDYFDELTKRLGIGLTDALNGVFDTTFFSRFSGVLGGGLGGYATGGGVGGIIGLVRGIQGLPEGLKAVLERAQAGAATGTAVAGIGKSLGMGISTNGSQIGGAIGGALGIPGLDIIGSIAGGIIGKLLGGHKSGRATIGGIDGALGITGTGGNKSSFIKAASGSADSITGSIERLADALGAEVNAAIGNVTIGIRDGKYRVNTDGTSLKTSKGAVNFGKDGQAEAIAFATADLIRDGVLTGLRNTTLNILKKPGSDLENQIQKALDFEGVFNALKAIKDPVGAAVDALDKEFTKLRKTFTDASATTEEFTSLEELYTIKRAEAVKQARQQIVGSLQDLYDNLTIGDSGLSLRSRLSSARAAYDPLAARVAAGDTTAFDDFSSAATTLLELQRQLYGSQGGYFELFDAIKNLTKSALDAQTAIADASANSDSPFSASSVPTNDNAAVVSAIDQQTGVLSGYLQAVNDNIAALPPAIAQAVRDYLASGGRPGGIQFQSTF